MVWKQLCVCLKERRDIPADTPEIDLTFLTEECFFTSLIRVTLMQIVDLIWLYLCVCIRVPVYLEMTWTPNL